MPRTQPDRTSRVPRFHFADTLEEQERQLAENPLVQRFAESRQRLAADPHRPAYHYVNPESTLNDPNGLCFWRGRWHLFYQAYPPDDRRLHWGHAVSDDLIHWRDLPYAIYPDPEECCFSGATFVEEDRVVAIYHGTKVGNMVAVSSDPLLLNWEKLTGQPVIPLARPDGSPQPFNVFDPCVWKKGDWYYSLSAGATFDGPGGKRVRADFLLRSRDLTQWEYLHTFVENDRYSRPGDDGACPYFWPIGDKHILLYYSHMRGGQYILGDYDRARDKLVATDGGMFNFGPSDPCGVHAPSAYPDGSAASSLGSEASGSKTPSSGLSRAPSSGEGGVIVIFNMNPGRPANGWDQIMTLPRRLTLGDDERLGMSPAGDVESLRRKHVHLDATDLPANRDVVLEEVRGNALEIVAEIDPADAPMIEMNVLRSPDAEETTRILFQPNRGYRNVDVNDWSRFGSLITLDNTRSSLLPDARSRAPETANVLLEKDEPVRLRVFVDRSVVEVFVNDRQCVALRAYPSREDSVGVSLRSQGRGTRLRSLDAWQMASIYE